jgi:tetratricopeptide (TPR) repeat protein
MDPNWSQAHELAANLLLEDAKTDEAVKEANAAIALSPDALDAMATLAAADLLADKNADADNWLKKIAAVNPNYGEGYEIVARHLVLNRRYPEGVAYYRKAIAADPPTVVGALRVGHQSHASRRRRRAAPAIRTGYNNGQTDAATVIASNLLDSYKNFVTTRDDYYHSSDI